MHEVFVLYRFYADDGALLYVGVTNNPTRRFSKHEDDKPWWHEVRGITVEHYNTREDVLAAERRAIEVEHPRYNIKRPSILRASKAAAASTKATWVCDACDKWVRDGDGYIHISYDEIYRAVADQRRWQADHHHRSCDPDISGNDYHFDVARARTVDDLLDWTLHLSEKAWLVETDWIKFLRTRRKGEPKKRDDGIPGFTRYRQPDQETTP